MPRRVLLSTPIPRPDIDGDLVARLREGESNHLVTKLDAGRVNENVKRPHDLVVALNEFQFPGGVPDFDLLYADSMFPKE